MTVDWRTLRDHRPAGAYLPVGALDGDCRQGDGAWPCEAALEALETYGFRRDDALRDAVKRYVASWEGLAMGDCAYPEELEQMVRDG